MGTKRKIASHVAAVIEDGPSGPMLDLFSGVCAVSSAVAPDRQVWCNDVQAFASTVARAYFTSPLAPISADDAASTNLTLFLENRLSLEERFSDILREEDLALQLGDTERLAAFEVGAPNVASSDSLERERKSLERAPSTTPYRQFSITFSGAYLGLRQCIEVDSIRYAIDQSLHCGKLDAHQHQWMCLALCQAVGRVATTTGHFAQYLRVKKNNQKQFVAQRCRSVWHEWLSAIFQMSPVGTRDWRSRNRVFMKDANELLQMLKERELRPAVIYADPPYTSDHYSRFYHLYETLLLYDYPPSQATGRYRPDRFFSRYSKKTEVAIVMERLISGCAQLGSRLVLSYPEHGLLPNAREVIPQLIQNHYGKSSRTVHLDHFHSSLGGSKGLEKYPVKEMIFTAG